MSIVTALLVAAVLVSALAVCLWDTVRDHKEYRACLAARMSPDWPVRLLNRQESPLSPLPTPEREERLSAA